MLAKSRTASEKGRTRNVETNSIGHHEDVAGPCGTPGRDERVLEVADGPCFLMPDDVVDAPRPSRARNIGSAMRALAGIWMNGMTSKMLQKKMKKNSVIRKRRPLQARRCPSSAG